MIRHCALTLRYIANGNPSAAETLGGAFARRSNGPRIVAVSRFSSQETVRAFKTDPRSVSDLLPRSGTEKACRDPGLQAWRINQITVPKAGCAAARQDLFAHNAFGTLSSSLWWPIIERFPFHNPARDRGRCRANCRCARCLYPFFRRKSL